MRSWRNGKRSKLKPCSPCDPVGSTPTGRTYALVVELVDTLVLEASAGNGVRVRLPPEAPKYLGL